MSYYQYCTRRLELNRSSQTIFLEMLRKTDLPRAQALALRLSSAPSVHQSRSQTSEIPIVQQRSVRLAWASLQRLRHLLEERFFDNLTKDAGSSEQILQPENDSDSSSEKIDDVRNDLVLGISDFCLGRKILTEGVDHDALKCLGIVLSGGGARKFWHSRKDNLLFHDLVVILAARIKAAEDYQESLRWHTSASIAGICTLILAILSLELASMSEESRTEESRKLERQCDKTLSSLESGRGIASKIILLKRHASGASCCRLEGTYAYRVWAVALPSLGCVALWSEGVEIDMWLGVALSVMVICLSGAWFAPFLLERYSSGKMTTKYSKIEDIATEMLIAVRPDNRFAKGDSQSPGSKGEGTYILWTSGAGKDNGRSASSQRNEVPLSKRRKKFVAVATQNVHDGGENYECDTTTFRKQRSGSVEITKDPNFETAVQAALRREMSPETESPRTDRSPTPTLTDLVKLKEIGQKTCEMLGLNSQEVMEQVGEKNIKAGMAIPFPSGLADKLKSLRQMMQETGCEEGAIRDVQSRIDLIEEIREKIGTT